MKFKKYIAMTLAAGLLSGCNMDYEYQNGPSSGTFPSTKEEVEAGIMAAYKKVYAHTYSSTPFFGMLDNLSDIGTSRVTQTSLTVFKTSGLQATSAQASSLYQNIYKTVGRVHLVLDKLDELNGTVLTEDEYKAYKAELLLIRDFYYNVGAQMYGDMIFNDHSLSLDDYLYERTPYMDNVHRMIDELTDDLFDALPVRFNQGDYADGRLGRVGAYAMKARIALSWAHEDNSLYAEAARCARKALELAQGVYSLEPFDVTYCGVDHAEGEPNSAAKLFGSNGHLTSNEWIWGCQYSFAIDADSSHKGTYYNAPRTMGGCSYWGPHQGFMDAFQCIDGLPITESPLYDWQNPWKNRDPRLDLYTVRPGTRLLGYEFETAKKYTTVHNYNTGNDIANLDITTATKGEYSAQGSKGLAGYLWRKYMDKDELDYFGGIFGNSSSELPYPLMRLAEVYLIEAEANIEMDGGDLSLAAADINIIRERAHMPDLPAATASSQKAMRKALRYERMIELCDEGFRWFDIRRWKDDEGNQLAYTSLNQPMYAPNNSDSEGPVSNAIPAIDDNWNCTYDTNRTWDGKTFNLRVALTTKYQPEKDIHMPIPESELLANPLVKQNPYY